MTDFFPHLIVLDAEGKVDLPGTHARLPVTDLDAARIIVPRLGETPEGIVAVCIDFADTHRDVLAAVHAEYRVRADAFHEEPEWMWSSDPRSSKEYKAMQANRIMQAFTMKWSDQRDYSTRLRSAKGLRSLVEMCQMVLATRVREEVPA